MIVWNELTGHEGKPVALRKANKEDVIRKQKEYAAEQRGYIYYDDEEALMDFMSTHWAWEE